MLARVVAIALNAYREAVRARVLYGLFGLALATSAYALVVASLSLHQEARVVADLGSASMSLYAVIVAIVLGATSLHRELELKTLFPILSRPLWRHEYLLGKYVGTLATLAVFVAVDASAILVLLGLVTGQSVAKVAAVAGVLGIVLAAALIRAKYTRVFVLLPWSAALVAAAYVLAGTAPDERQMVVASALLSLSEVSILAAVATLFASFSSPYLTSAFTAAIFAVGRSSDTLANLPPKVFGASVRSGGQALARVVPNLYAYVPSRPLLLGQVPGISVWSYVALAAGHAALYAIVLLALSALIFRKRDFQ